MGIMMVHEKLGNILNVFSNSLILAIHFLDIILKLLFLFFNLSLDVSFAPEGLETQFNGSVIGIIEGYKLKLIPIDP